jgi:hypothetical protein
VKEFCESVPVIDSVRRSIAVMEAEEEREREKEEAGGGVSSGQPKQVTILDLCSGFGFLSMFLSEMLPAHRVKRIVLIDIQWSRKVLQKDIELGRELGVAKQEQKQSASGDIVEVEVKKEQEQEEEQEKAVKGKEKAVDDRAKYISADHLTGEFYGSWPIPLIASKQNLKERSNLKSMQKVIIDRALLEGDLMILGIHLCGVLSLRAVDLFNRNAARVRFFALKPCCLPGMFHAKNKEVFSIGQHSFPATEVSAPGKFVPTSKSKVMYGMAIDFCDVVLCWG